MAARPPTSPTAPPAKTSGGGRRLVRLSFLEDVFFLIATACTFLFAYLVVRAGGNLAEHIVALVAFWAIVAYLAMPRLNRMLTAIYLPDYFIGRARAADGVLGDPINLAARGSDAQLHTVMQRAGWTRADPVTLRSSWGIIMSSLGRRSYPAAPVSPLLLFGRPQDYAFQQEVDGNARQRHHVRFWRCPPGWILPGGHRVDWLAAGSYDRAVGLSLFTLQVTHKVDADIDVERDHIVQSVTSANAAVEVEVIADFSTGYHSRNGGGDRIHTDGSLPVLGLAAVTPSAESPAPARPRDLAARPPSVLVAIVLSLVTMMSLPLALMHTLLTNDPREGLGIAEAGRAGMARGLLVAALGAVMVGLVVLAVQTYRGSRGARVGLLALMMPSLVGHLTLGSPGPLGLLGLGVDLFIMYALTSPSARAWTRTPPPEPSPGVAAG